jgi:hypothetical protein
LRGGEGEPALVHVKPKAAFAARMPRFSSETPVRTTVTPSRLNATPTIVLSAGHRFGGSGPPVLYVGQGAGDGWRDAPRA